MIKSILYTVNRNDNTIGMKNYTGSCEGKIKNHYANHIASFRRRDKNDVTKLARYVLSLKDN